NEVVVRASDFQFDGRLAIPGGPTTFRLVNDGPDYHHLWLVRLEDGHTLDELLAHLGTGHAPPPWARDVGGPNTPGAPGEETIATLDLTPGSYAMLCVIPSPDGVPHIAKGMARALTVEPAVGTAAALPAADLVMTLDDYSFIVDRPITPGTHTIRVHNVASQPHEVLIVRLEPGRTVEEFAGWVEAREGPAPGRPIGGTTGMAQGEWNLITRTFEEGDYGLLRFIPDATDGAPHIVHGMMSQIRVG
ncbi:MAG: hypothetical protein ACRELC_01750, partial [Gemmatimonadota bacterium]